MFNDAGRMGTQGFLIIINYDRPAEVLALE